MYIFIFQRKVIWLAAALLALAGCQPSPQEKPQERTKKAHQVETVVVEKAALSSRRTVTGSLEPIRIVRIYNQEQGTITALPGYEGDGVEKGEELVRLEDALIRAELSKTVATRRQAQLDLKRLESLVPRKLASDDELARARTALELAKAEEALLRTRLGRTKIHAPFQGVISERLREPGDVVPLHSHILTLVDPSALKARIEVSEIALAGVASGTPVKMRIDALGDQLYDGEVLRVHPTIDPETRHGTIEVSLTPVPPGALPGQFCRIVLESHAADRRSVPIAALRRDMQGEYVFRIGTEGEARRVAVQTGLQFDDRIEIIEGLSIGDQIVIKGFLGLSDGKRVRAVNARKTPTPSPDRNG
ncbi:MAG: efflux RND transporter periplasmic adaptor subunit [Pseudomonadota bacterium]|nr:MAG: efflux RND transporter periplasmic adaptor subunit [Pseudomonadota bacterium]